MFHCFSFHFLSFPYYTLILKEVRKFFTIHTTNYRPKSIQTFRFITYPCI